LIVERPGVESTQQALNICEFRTGLRPTLMDETMAMTENGMIINGGKPGVMERSARLRTNAGR
jgi:hypothetical protein